MLDFLIFWLWGKLQDSNWLEVKFKSRCFLLKFLSHMKPDKDEDKHSDCNTVAHSKDQQVPPRSLLKHLRNTKNNATSANLESNAENSHKLALPQNKACPRVHSLLPQACAAASALSLPMTAGAFGSVRVFRFIRQTALPQNKACPRVHSLLPQARAAASALSLPMTAGAFGSVRVFRFIRQTIRGEGLFFIHRITIIGISLDRFTSGIPHAHNEVMEICSSVYDIPLQGSCKLLQLTAAEEIDDQDQPLTSSTPHAHNEVMEIGSSVYDIPLQGSCELLQLTAAEEIEDQDQSLTSENSLLPLEYKPEEEKRNLKKLELPILDGAEFCSHPKLMSDIKNVKEKYGNGIVTIRECEDRGNVLVDLRLNFTVVKNGSVMDGLPPFIVSLCFCLSNYIDGNEPTVELIEPDKKVDSINLLLIERILKTFFTLRWKMMNLPPTNKTNCRRGQ
uniref:uncharacterized protein n=1 Tax=Myxine glutinosa TaxID=7769 RepID=UPI00358EBC71